MGKILKTSLGFYFRRNRRFCDLRQIYANSRGFKLLHLKISKALLTWREGNPAGRVTLLGGLPSSIVFPGFVYMRGRVTPGGG